MFIVLTLHLRLDAGPGPRECPEGVELLSDKEREFWDYFKDLVSEWNPCYASDGQWRFVWDDEVGAHDVDVTEPERVRLRPVLDRLFADEDAGKPLDLAPLRRLVTALVQTSGRHDMHGQGAPLLGKHPCARGKAGCAVCRYGFPHKLQARSGRRPFRLVRGDKKGSWFGRFPRNDGLCCSYNPHLLLANMGNIDWRPVLTLWAVVQYVTKYATKAASGSRHLSDTLRDVVDEVCKHAAH